MAPPHRRRRSPAPWPVLNRLAQLNVAIAVCIGAMIRLSMDFAGPTDDQPNPLMVLGFFAVMAAAIWLILRLRRDLRRLPKRWQRVLAAVLTFAIQFGILEVLLLTVAA